VSAQSKPKPAATVILLRRAERRGLEVLLTRRSARMPFLGGMYCFPGGSVREEDGTDQMLKRCFGLTRHQARKIIGDQVSPEQAMGFWVAAVRELFEEVGVLLAVEESGSPLLLDAARANLLGRKQEGLLNHSLSFLSLLEAEKLRCDLGGLAHFSHWQTPSQIATRYDTHFFIGPFPRDQTARAISEEVAHTLWLTPDRSLELFKRGELPMSFPTYASLRTLADYETLEAVATDYFGTLGR
jgi:8-oxo-dGTP pyrophosphatase MutT (NUDIX family)